MKLLTWLLLRHYDGLFSDTLYSFRPGRTAKDAVRRLFRLPGIREKYAYKVDVSNYFNSIPISRLLPMLEESLKDDPALSAFLKRLLMEPFVLDHGVPIEEEKGIMAGTPLSAFFANLYLKELDNAFASRKIPYVRYSDDIIVFADTPETVLAHAQEIRSFLADMGLSVNSSKEHFFTPGEGWSFLGFYCRDNVIDIAPATLDKLKQKMRRKARSLKRWQDRNDRDSERAAAAFIRIFNRKLLESPMDNELSWSCWFFSVINTADSLRTIDHYAQECIRFLLSGTHTKARYRFRYEDLKRLGYRSLVHEYYSFEKPRPHPNLHKPRLNP